MTPVPAIGFAEGWNVTPHYTLMAFRDRVWLLAVASVGVIRRHAGIVLVLIVALAARLIYLHWFKVFPPGDVFNFINIARGLADGVYPISERRLPFYPLLILLAHSVLGWEAAALAVAVAASLAAIVLIYALGRTLGISKTALVALLLVLQVHPQLLTATRGYADTTLFALLPAAILALLRARSWKGGVVTGLLLGALTLTRYEGATAALVLLPLWFVFPVQHRPRRPDTTWGTGLASKKDTPQAQHDGQAGTPRGSRRLAAVAALAFVLSLAPYLVLSAVNQRPPFGAGYVVEAEGREGYGSGNIQEFRESFQGIWKRNGLFGVWEIPGAITREIIEDPFGTPRILSRRFIEVGETLALLAVLGFVALILRKQRGAVFLIAATAAATVPPAWFNPLPRYDIVVLPLLALLAARGVSAVQALVVRGTRPGGRAGTAVRWLAGATLMTLATSIWSVTYAEETRNRQQKHNGREYAYYQAIHAARRLPGKIAFDRDPDMVRLYFGDRAVIFRGVSGATATPEDARAELHRQGVTYLVLPHPENQPQFASFLVLPDVTLEQSLEWVRGNNDISRAAIYRIGP